MNQRFKIFLQNAFGNIAFIAIILQIIFLGLIALFGRILPHDGALFWFGSIFNFIGFGIIFLTALVGPLFSAAGIITGLLKQKSILLSAVCLIFFILEYGYLLYGYFTMPAD